MTAWRRREPSEADIYHVTMRGSGRQLIFEDDLDRARFLETLEKAKDGAGTRVQLLAWCLMGNHVHLLVRAQLECLAAFMRKVGASYAMYFNKRHDRVGHLLQGRYGSVPIKTDAQLIATVRYIHRNPVEAGLSPTCDWPWSSYGEYFGRPGVASTDMLLDLVGGADAFRILHIETGNESLSPRSQTVTRMTDAAARDELSRVLDSVGLREVPTSSKDERDRVLVLLKEAGLSVRQIERLTSIGRNIVARAGK